MNARFVMAALIVWGLWGMSWVMAGLWHARTVSTAPRRTFALPLTIAFVGFGCLVFGRVATRDPLWLLPAWLGWGLVGLTVASAAFGWWARLHLGKLWSGAIVRREGHRIVDTGPYALVRHPIYTALIGGAIGLAGARATPLALIGALLIAIGFALKARVEERFLRAEFGEQAYAAYARRVPMLVPFLP